MSISFSQTNVRDQIEYIYSFLKPEADKKGIQLVLKNLLIANDVIIRTDREKVNAILMTLVSNAINYSDGGTIELGYHLLKTRGIANESDLSDEIEFFIKDTGTGLTLNRYKAFLDRIVPDGITDEKTCQGELDISITKAYVNMLGGKMRVENEKGVGSVFYVTIPGDYESQVNEISDHSGTKDKIKNLKILIAEDDEISGMLLTIGVKAFGNEVLKVHTGLEAVETCLNNPDIDLVLMDIKMPELDGYEATRQIRMFNTDVIIIAQTAYALMGDREKAIEAGCNEYIAKPFGNASLGSVIRKCFLSS